MMKKILMAFTCIMLSACSLCACSKKEEPLPEIPYESVEYTIYPAPDGGFVGDTMPFVTEGRLELYYLYDTTQNGQGYHPIYKYSTDNFYDYKDHGKMLNYGLMSDPDPAIGTGSVLFGQDGQYHLFYTGHNDVSRSSGKGRECVMHAVSSDSENWTKIPEDTFYSEENYSGDDFRDPFVFWNEEENCYWLLIAAREKTHGGVVAKYTSDDLKTWTICEPLFAPHDQYMLECPDLFKLGDKYYLIYSWDCVTYYAMADSMNGPFTIPKDNVLDGKNFAFYAAKTGELNGTRYLCGWIGRPTLTSDTGMYDWAGNMLNHQITQREDGTLGVREPESFSEYFTEDLTFKAITKIGKVKSKDGVITLDAEGEKYALSDLGSRVATMMLECDVKLEENGCAGFAFGGAGTDEEYTALCLDAANGMLHYEGNTIEELATWDPVNFTKFDFSKNEIHHVKLICENEIIVMYVDDMKALSTRNLHSVDGAHIGLFSSVGYAEFSNITIKVPGTN